MALTGLSLLTRVKEKGDVSMSDPVRAAGYDSNNERQQ
jgi:hypothetical protein